jgi:methyl-accepting chemotaxis protein
MDKSRDNQSSNTRRQELVSYLDTEINYLQYDIRRSGWTKWAVCSGIAALAWLLISQIEGGGYSSVNVIGILLVIGLIVIFFLMTAIMVDNTDSKVEGRFHVYGYWSRNRASQLLLIGQLAFLLYANNSLSQYVATWTKIVTYLLCGGLLLAAISFFIITSLKFPTSVNPRRNKASVSLNAVGIAVSALAAWRYIDFMRMSPVTVNASDVRVALLIAAMLFLAQLLLGTGRGSLILESLRITRRQLALDQTGLESAIVEVDIALTGLRARDVLEEHVGKLLTLYREASEQLRESMQYLNDIKTLYRESQDEKAQESLVKPLLKSLAKSIDSTGDIIRDIRKTFRPFTRRLFWMRTQEDISDAVNELVQKLEDATDNLAQQMNGFSESLRQFEKTHGIEQLQD